MHNNLKTWLVRTKKREILGPFTQRQLVEELNLKSFTIEDEICIVFGFWISAQSLWNRDSEEVTHTSTRNQTLTHSISETSGPQILQLDIEEDLTPTPNAILEQKNSTFQLQKTTNQSSRNGINRSITITVIAVISLGLLLNLRTRKEITNTTIPTLSSSGENESPFIKQIYGHIHSGELGTALRKLTQYHEKAQKKDELDYLIPYSALLITEGESIARAKKFLEHILNSTQSTPQLKSRAHHWLGYLLLSQEEGDAGEGHFLEALQLNPKDAAARFNLGRSYLKQEKYSQALDYLQLAELEMPDLWLVHIYKGRAKVALGNMEEARNAFKKAIQSSPDRWITYIYYSLYLIGIRDFDEARLTLKKMMTRDPHYELHSPPPLGFYQEKINYAEYLNAFTHVMDKGTSDEKEIGKIYINYLMNGGQDEDFKRFESLAEKGSLATKVIALKVLLDRKISAPEIKTALARLPNDLSSFGPYAYVLRGDAKVRLSLYAEAQEDFVSALKLDPKSAISHWAYAGLLERQQKKEEAHAEIQNLLSYHPNYIPAVVSSHQF